MSRAPDKVLLFAEVQGVDVNEAKLCQQLSAVVSGSGDATDGVLDYQSEVIGFNHKSGAGLWGGHVAFADGHVQKLLCPRSGSLSDLTGWLCRGYEVSYDGRQYTALNEDE